MIHLSEYKYFYRRTVSTFLSSDFRERMDKLMESHRGTQTHLVNRQDEVEDNQALMAFLQERLHPASRPQEDGRERVEKQEEEEEGRNEKEEEVEEEEEAEAEEEEEKVEEQEGESLISSSYHQVGDYFNQSSSTHLTTWSYRGNETGDDFDIVASTSSQPSESQSFCQDSRRNSSSTNQHSIVSLSSLIEISEYKILRFLNLLFLTQYCCAYRKWNSYMI